MMMNTLKFGGFYTFQYPGNLNINKRNLAQQFDNIHYGLVHGGSCQATNEYNLDTYPLSTDQGLQTVLTLSTSESVDQNQNVIHQMLLKIAEAFGEQAVADVRQAIRDFSKSDDRYGKLRAFFTSSEKSAPTEIANTFETTKDVSTPPLRAGTDHSADLPVVTLT